MKRLLIALSMFSPAFSPDVLAFDFEVGYGLVKYEKQMNGIWYQDGFPNEVDLNTSALSIGVSKQIGKNRYRLEYLAMGNAMSNAVATSDTLYTPYYTQTCAPDCRLYKYQGFGDVKGVVLSASRPVQIFGIPFYAEAGAFFYVPSWRVEVYTLPPGEPELLGTMKHDPKLEIGPMLGFGVRYSGVDIGLRYLRAEATSDDLPGVYKDAYTLMFKVYF